MPATAPELSFFCGVETTPRPSPSRSLAWGSATSEAPVCALPVAGRVGEAPVEVDATDAKDKVVNCVGAIPAMEVKMSSMLELLFADVTGRGTIVEVEKRVDVSSGWDGGCSLDL